MKKALPPAHRSRTKVSTKGCLHRGMIPSEKDGSFPLLLQDQDQTPQRDGHRQLQKLCCHQQRKAYHSALSSGLEETFDVYLEDTYYQMDNIVADSSAELVPTIITRASLAPLPVVVLPQTQVRNSSLVFYTESVAMERIEVVNRAVTSGSYSSEFMTDDDTSSSSSLMQSNDENDETPLPSSIGDRIGIQPFSLPTLEDFQSETHRYIKQLAEKIEPTDDVEWEDPPFNISSVTDKNDTELGYIDDHYVKEREEIAMIDPFVSEPLPLPKFARPSRPSHEHDGEESTSTGYGYSGYANLSMRPVVPVEEEDTPDVKAHAFVFDQILWEPMRDAASNVSGDVRPGEHKLASLPDDESVGILPREEDSIELHIQTLQRSPVQEDESSVTSPKPPPRLTAELLNGMEETNTTAKISNKIPSKIDKSAPRSESSTSASSSRISDLISRFEQKSGQHGPRSVASAPASVSTRTRDTLSSSSAAAFKNDESVQENSIAVKSVLPPLQPPASRPKSTTSLSLPGYQSRKDLVDSFYKARPMPSKPEEVTSLVLRTTAATDVSRVRLAADPAYVIGRPRTNAPSPSVRFMTSTTAAPYNSARRMSSGLPRCRLINATAPVPTPSSRLTSKLVAPEARSLASNTTTAPLVRPNLHTSQNYSHQSRQSTEPAASRPLSSLLSSRTPPPSKSSASLPSAISIKSKPMNKAISNQNSFFWRSHPEKHEDETADTSASTEPDESIEAVFVDPLIIRREKRAQQMQTTKPSWAR